MFLFMSQHSYITKPISHGPKEFTALWGLIWNSDLEKKDPIAHSDTAEPTDIQSGNFELNC